MLYAHASDCLNCSLKMGGFQGVFLSGKKSVRSGSGRERGGGGGVKKLPYKNDEGARRVLRGFSTS